MDYTEPLQYRWYGDGSSIAGATTSSYKAEKTGDYHVVMRTSEGCEEQSIDNVDIVFHEQPPVPTLSITDGESSICPDEKITMAIGNHSDSPDILYTWKWNGNEIEGKTGKEMKGTFEAGEYRVEATSGSSCTETSNAVKIVHKNVPENPVLYANSGSDIYYISSSVINADEYRWYYNGEFLPKAHKFYYLAGKNLGRYYVEIKDLESGCSVKSDEIIIPGGYVGIHDVGLGKDILILPNPNEGDFVIQNKSELPIQKIEIEDVTRRCLYSDIEINERNNIKVESGIVKSGVYFLKIICNDTFFTLPFLIF